MMKITNVTELVVNTATVPENGKTDDGFAQELDKATDSKTETVKDDSVAAKEPADAEADAVQKAPGEKAEPEEEQPDAGQAGLVAAAIPLPLESIPVQDVQPAESTPTPETEAVDRKGPLPQQTQPVLQEKADILDEQTNEAVKKQPEQANRKPEQAAVLVNREAEPFVRQALSEADAIVRQQAGDSGKTDQTFTVPALQPEEAVSEESKESGSKEKQGGGEKAMAQSPMTANVTKEGKVEFQLAGEQQPEYQQVQQKEELLPKLIDQIKSTVTKEKTEFFLQLKPEHLGGLSILLSAEDKGIVAKLMTSSKDVQQVMQSDMTAMQEALRDKGINVVQMEVIYGQMTDSASKDNGGSRQWNETKGGGHGGSQESIESATAFYDNLSYYDVLAEQGGSVEFSA